MFEFRQKERRKRKECSVFFLFFFIWRWFFHIDIRHDESYNKGIDFAIENIIWEICLCIVLREHFFSFFRQMTHLCFSLSYRDFFFLSYKFGIFSLTLRPSFIITSHKNHISSSVGFFLIDV